MMDDQTLSARIAALAVAVAGNTAATEQLATQMDGLAASIFVAPQEHTVYGADEPVV